MAPVVFRKTPSQMRLVDVFSQLPCSRGTRRFEIYLRLNKILMEEEETPDRVSEMLNQLGRTIQEFEVDITQSNNIMLQHIALRTVSYYMYHKTLSAAFSASQIETVLSAIIGTLFRTQNEVRWLINIPSLY